MTTFRATVPTALILLITLGACSHTDQDETQWARAALARNTLLDVVSSDPAAGTLTVRIKSTGELRTVHPGDLIAALPGEAGKSLDQAAPAAPAASSPAAPPLPTAPPVPAASTPAASTAAPASAVPPEPEATAGSSAQDESAKPSPAPILRRASGPSGRVLAAGPGYSISDASSAAAAPPPKTGETLVAGPGYSIRDAGPGTPSAASGQAPSAAAAADSPVRNVAVEQHHDPIICQGGRLLRIDGKNLEFDGDAVSAENGCDLQITNSRIAAKGTAVAAHNASVRIENSVIDGATGAAIVATDHAQVYAQQSTFKGVIRREDTAAFHDLGGNVGN